MRKIISVVLLISLIFASFGCTSSNLTPEEKAYNHEFKAIFDEFSQAFNDLEAELEKVQAGISSERQFAEYHNSTYLPKIRELRNRAIDLDPPEGYAASYTKFTFAMGGILMAAELNDRGWQEDEVYYIKQANPILNDAMDDLIQAIEELKKANQN